MSEGGTGGTTADAQLQRILQMLPLASREGGASFDELAAALGVSREQVERDLEEVTAREYYQRAGSGLDIGIGVARDRVSAWTGGEHFGRPARLNLREAAALHLGLLLLAGERGDAGLAERARELEARLAWAVPDDVESRVVVTDAGAGDALRAALVEAAKTRRTVRLSYLKPDAPEPESREVDPYQVVYAGGSWYLIGHCHARGAPRTFRVDRVVEAETTDAAFERPADFDVADYVRDGHVHSGDGGVEVAVRYAARVARWLEGRGEAAADGSVVVRHRVTDPGWVVRHVLQYGADAEVLEPPAVREMVRAAASRLREAATAEPAVAGG